MDPMTGLAIYQGVSSLVGMLGANRARARALAERQRLMREFSNMFAREEGEFADVSGRNFYSQAGQLNDTLPMLGGALGSGLARAGVFNSSATAGALANQGASNAQAMASLAAQNRFNLGRLRSGNQRALMGMQMGNAREDLYNADQDLAGARSGLMSALGTGTQLMLRRNNVPSGRNTGPAGNGYNNSVLEGTVAPGLAGNIISKFKPRLILQSNRKNPLLGQI